MIFHFRVSRGITTNVEALAKQLPRNGQNLFINNQNKGKMEIVKNKTDRHTEAIPQMDGSFALKKNGVMMQCPFQPALISYGPPKPLTQEPTVNITRLPCATSCPFAEIEKLNTGNCENYTYVIRCGLGTQHIKLQNEPGELD